MEKQELDMLNISAYSDSSYARDRELWRGFLSYVLPSVLSFEGSKIEKVLTNAVVESFEELTHEAGQNVSNTENIRYISMQIAKAIGMPPEFGLASFFEGSAPTRLYKIKSKIKKKNVKEREEDYMIAQWLESLSRVQADKKFSSSLEQWKSWMKEE